MKRSRITLEEVADWHNLTLAFHRAARGKGGRLEVRRFRADLDEEISRLRKDILDGSIEVGRMRRFSIRDPKPRIIHAPCFRERVLHHALIAHIGPVLDRSLIDDTFACRVGKGTLAAVRRAQFHQRRHPWFAQIDIDGYFAGIDHRRLLEMLRRRFKNRALLRLIERIIDAHHAVPGKGLPIGALTSQCFANYYLSGLDRLLLEGCRIDGMVRYMDDLVWWGKDRSTVREALAKARSFAEERLGLVVKQPVRIGRAAHGLTFCGFRILPGRVLLSRRRKQRYARHRCRWESAYAAGLIDERTLQKNYGSALALTVHADARSWRWEQLCRHPVAIEGYEP